MKRYQSFLITGLILSAIASLSACHRENPMMQEQIIDTMKGRLFLNDADFPIRDCSRFYAGTGDKNWKDKCDRWSASYYKSMLTLGELPHNTTLEQFRSPDFWKLVATQ